MRPDYASPWHVFIALCTVNAVGCSPEAQRYIRFPTFASPGPAALQRAEAVQHDPYPLNDIGPEIVGGRPLAYQQPLDEVERAKLVPARPVVIQPMPAPGSNVVAPPVISSPYAVAPPQPAMPLAPSRGPAPVVTALPTSAPPVVMAPLPAVPTPGAVPSYSLPPAPIATPTYPVSPVGPITSPPLQPRAPY
jgi:hypothetical protein